ncbi:rhodanese-like domain-containing protein [Spirulina sp. CS-785/01]|uniref:rhodanese-like domain-containing protein n=1 Tax=Spirulina sp. CS-785/01 TaxID=3021716 RepID=UPI00232B9580|nr:rhodanese-like domain-containing protein [Spirulina sp. CS-785/01]MDB9313733.1 rhodanese-like domain-containing protein [Spirulina sp. CS-785/01]
MLNFLPTPPPLQPKSRADELKYRLDWGEPALTIIDVRDRKDFNTSHIVGAIPIPLGELVERIEQLLERDRDIYIYGNSDTETADAAEKLREAGFTHVSELRGGVAAWQAFGYPIESGWV